MLIDLKIIIFFYWDGWIYRICYDGIPISFGIILGTNLGTIFRIIFCTILVKWSRTSTTVVVIELGSIY